MIAAMALELTVWLYAISLILVSGISVTLLISASRVIGRLARENAPADQAPTNATGETDETHEQP